MPLPSPGDLPNPGIKPRSPTLQADSLLTGPPGKPPSWGIRSASFHLRVKLLSPLFSQSADGLTCSGILSSPILSDSPSLGSVSLKVLLLSSQSISYCLFSVNWHSHPFPMGGISWIIEALDVS